ncbi:hypothetical protein EN828_20480 [Mesorhizobium sp. M2D.F.Ca.ET.185.01.1.1]|uniref:hypothetical protein n=1 Tax=unclassified Mesorhizobium TaxID=325217 RepID=UPI000FCC5168|nr:MULTISPECIES: hypothetical protein [unclassified Mesorhizobium]TGP78838.1 hypothetical protein EN870_15255 [bacterium M00.F.Ca.ET.227.01.1.1]TGP89633.1 hypothetical protein EN864_21090 [bacterium M00.F.Ca.ET.221.01.1.1]TGP95000.1 hypothetical protein EN865_16960 [bacterium M00.F.Ca.ET.222.01.1.1]TGU02499.1 hypothetical protein EN806_45205 [bacterium M00.F.Ca.ET.163.01.1.1]TGU18997.1 hypothetical protein EN799_59410 [bacterium M00.F.Ca.ET.156.01.1.1]TGU45989.1 hypothetical protein EN789_181
MVRRQADAANLALKIKIGAAIGRAEAEAPDEIERTGSYSGQIPGEDAYKIVYGPDEGPKRRQGLDWQIDVRKNMFDMRTMSNQAINAALNDAASETGGSQKSNPQRLSTAVAAMRVLTRRRTDAWGAAADAVPAIAAAWKAAIGGGLEDPNGYNKEAYDKAIAMALAAQERLGIENPQLVPQDVIQELAGSQNSRSLYQQEKNAKTTALLAGTLGPARAAVGRQLAAAGLGWIMPVASGYQRPSTGSIFASEAKALGKVVANAGIAASNAKDWAAYRMSGGAVSPPEYKDYYRPANAVEDLMMQQGSDAAAWGLGEGAPKAIARATELVGPRATAQAERSIAGKSFASSEVADNPTSQAASRPVAAEKAGEVRPAAGEGTATASPPKRKPDFFRQPTSSLDDLYAVAPKWQADLEGAGQQIADQVGAKFVTNGAKQRETAYEKIGRNEYKDASRLIDIVRISFVVKNPAQADEIAALLAQRYKVRDGKWHGKMDSAYFDRKVTVRFDDGTLGEVQMLEPNMYKAKAELGGQAKYTRRRNLYEEDPEYLDLLSQEAALYSDARRNADSIWAEVLANLKGGAASPKSQ